jgi:hypothetical protein
MSATVQNRKGWIFLKARVRETKTALVKDCASIGTNEANMTTAFTKPDSFL